MRAGAFAAKIGFSLSLLFLATFRLKNPNFGARRSYGRIEKPRWNGQRGSMKLR